MDTTTVTIRPAVGTDLPCGAVCQVATWPGATSNGLGGGTPWCCPAFDGRHVCTRHEGHRGRHVSCEPASDNPAHHNVHTWNDDSSPAVDLADLREAL